MSIFCLCRYVYLLMGVLIGSAVIPIAYCLVWSKCTAKAAIIGAVSGLCLAVMSWLVTAKTLYGEISLASTGTHPHSNVPGNNHILCLPCALLWVYIIVAACFAPLPSVHTGMHHPAQQSMLNACCTGFRRTSMHVLVWLKGKAIIGSFDHSVLVRVCLTQSSVVPWNIEVTR